MTDPQTTLVQAPASRPASVARIGLLGAVAAAVVAAAILAFGAITTPAGTLAAGTTDTQPAVGIGLPGFGNGPMDGRMGHDRGFGAITITAIAGVDVTLATEDGWIRTIGIASDTILTKGTATITKADLKVGDEVRFAQTRQTDGSYKITKLGVILPHVGGAVTDVSGSTITVTERDGSTATIKVTSATTFQVGRTDGKALADIKVGMHVGAIGTLNSDGSLTATAVHAFDPAKFPGRGDHNGHGPWDKGGAPATAPDGSADGSAG